ncbi:hypothetical protein V8E51_001436 [Hyaloscypha variabilis]
MADDPGATEIITTQSPQEIAASALNHMSIISEQISATDQNSTPTSRNRPAMASQRQTLDGANDSENDGDAAKPTKEAETSSTPKRIPGLKFSIPASMGKRKKRMDKAWWDKIETLSIYDPSEDDIDFRMMFGANTENEFDPDLEYADCQWSDAAAGTGLLAIQLGYVTYAQAARFVAVYTAEGKLLRSRKHVGAPFLGPDGSPLLVNDDPMCGDEAEWENKKSAYSIDDVISAENYEEWLDKVLRRKGKQVQQVAAPVPEVVEQSKEEFELGINVLPREITKHYAIENKKLKIKMNEMLGEYHSAMEAQKDLTRQNTLLVKELEKIARQRVRELEIQITTTSESMVEVGKAFETGGKGNGVLILDRFTGCLRKAIGLIEKEQRILKQKANEPDSPPRKESEDSDSDSNSESEEDNDVGGDTKKSKRRATSPASASGTAKKSAKVIPNSSPSHSRNTSQKFDTQNFSTLQEYLTKDTSLYELFEPPKPLEPPPPRNAKEFIKKNGNPLDHKQQMAERARSLIERNVPVPRALRNSNNDSKSRAKQPKNSTPKKQPKPKNSKKSGAKIKKEAVNESRRAAGELLIEEDSELFDEDGYELPLPASSSSSRKRTTKKSLAGAKLKKSTISTASKKPESRMKTSSNQQIDLVDARYTKSLDWDPKLEKWTVIWSQNGVDIQRYSPEFEDIPDDGTPGWPPKDGIRFVLHQETATTISGSENNEEDSTKAGDSEIEQESDDDRDIPDSLGRTRVETLWDPDKNMHFTSWFDKSNRLKVRKATKSEIDALDRILPGQIDETDIDILTPFTTEELNLYKMVPNSRGGPGQVTKLAPDGQYYTAWEGRNGGREYRRALDSEISEAKKLDEFYDPTKGSREQTPIESIENDEIETSGHEQYEEMYELPELPKPNAESGSLVTD